MKMKLLILLFALVYTTSFAQQNDDERWQKLTLSDSVELQKTWTIFKTALENKDILNLKKNSLEEVKCDMFLGYEFNESESKDFIIPIDIFLSQALKTYSGSQLEKSIKTRGYVGTVRTLYDYKPRNLPVGYGKDLTIYELYIQTFKPNEWAKGHEGQSHAFQFVKVNGEFKFFGLTSIP